MKGSRFVSVERHTEMASSRTIRLENSHSQCEMQKAITEHDEKEAIACEGKIDCEELVLFCPCHYG